MEDKEFNIDLMEIIYLLKRNLIVILIISLIFGFSGFLATKLFIKPQYSSTSTMIVSNKVNGADNQINTTINSGDLQASQGLIKTYGIIVKSDTVLNKVIENLGIDETAETLSSKITVSSLEQTQVMEIKVIDHDVDKAQMIMEEITKVAPDIIVDAVGAGNCSVLSQAKPSSGPVSPDVKKNTMLSVILGLVLSVIFIIVREFINNTVKTEEDISEKLGIPVLGIIPKIGGE